jgi:hypothetical protein
MSIFKTNNFHNFLLMGDWSIIIFVLASVIFILGFTPDSFAANANLFVSAENSQFDNYMSGPQVIEVVVIDSSRRYSKR